MWVAHADAGWSAAHLGDAPEAIVKALKNALRMLLPGAAAVRWHHAAAHRWRYAALVAPVAGDAGCGWAPHLNLGVCGDFFGEGTVEAAWRLGDELADAVVAWLEAEQAAARAIAGASAGVSAGVSVRAASTHD